MKQIISGVLLLTGALVVAGLRLGGIRTPRYDTAYSRGSEEGFWIGTGIGIVIALSMIAQGVLSRKPRSGKDNRSWIERLSTVEISKTTYALVVIAFGILAFVVTQFTGIGGR